MQLESNRFSVGKVSPLEIACFSLSSASRADLFKINCHSNQNIWRDITRKHCVINIQHDHCGLVRSSPQRLLPAMGIPMNHAKCCMSASRHVSLVAMSSSPTLYANMTSSTKPEICNVSQRRQRRPWVMRITNLVKIGHVLPKI